MTSATRAIAPFNGRLSYWLAIRAASEQGRLADRRISAGAHSRGTCPVAHDLCGADAAPAGPHLDLLLARQTNRASGQCGASAARAHRPFQDSRSARSSRARRNSPAAGGCRFSAGFPILADLRSRRHRTTSSCRSASEWPGNAVTLPTKAAGGFDAEEPGRAALGSADLAPVLEVQRFAASPPHWLHLSRRPHRPDLGSAGRDHSRGSGENDSGQ